MRWIWSYVIHIVDAAHLLFDGRRHRLLDGLSIGAHTRGDDLNLGWRDIGKEGYGKPNANVRSKIEQTTALVHFIDLPEVRHASLALSQFDRGAAIAVASVRISSKCCCSARTMSNCRGSYPGLLLSPGYA